MTQRARHIFELDKDMRKALENNEMQVYFQPIYELGIQKLGGVEALIRWEHPVRGTIDPDDFMAVAEDTGLIEEIGLWVLRQACRDVLIWSKNHETADFYLSVNLSAMQIKGGFNQQKLNEILEQTGFPADRLVFEINEALLMENDIRIQELLSDLTDMGIRFSVDNFGTGISSLSNLRDFPVHSLKIDRSYIKDLLNSKNDQRLVEGIISMANSLDLITIAEGVESPEQESLLLKMNCKMGQGLYYPQPTASH